MEQDSGHSHETTARQSGGVPDGGDAPPGNVVPIRVPWFGSPADLVPIGPRPAAAPADAGDFWGESAPLLHEPIAAPEPARAAGALARERLALRRLTRTRVPAVAVALLAAALGIVRLTAAGAPARTISARVTVLMPRLPGTLSAVSAAVGAAAGGLRAAGVSSPPARTADRRPRRRPVPRGRHPRRAPARALPRRRAAVAPERAGPQAATAPATGTDVVDPRTAVAPTATQPSTRAVAQPDLPSPTAARARSSAPRQAALPANALPAPNGIAAP
jgi:hypothetical protein